MSNKKPERKTSLWNRALSGEQEKRLSTTSGPIYENARAKFQSVVRRVNMAQTALHMLPSTSSVVHRRRSAGRHLSDEVQAELRAAVARAVSQHQPTPTVLACLSPPPVSQVVMSKARRSFGNSVSVHACGHKCV